MSMALKLKRCLEEQRVPHAVMRHPARFTAPEVAEALHVPGREVAKVVVLRTDAGFAMAVLPSDRVVDLDAFARVAGARYAVLAREEEFADLFPDCEPGSMPPFGNLYGLPVFADDSLALDEEIVFEAGNHEEAVRMAYVDFVRVVRPVSASFARRPGESRPR
jgi:Ala-tRNA(Pro) deacylase